MNAIIVHGWDGNPNAGWMNWLGDELQKKEWDVLKLELPEVPEIESWTKVLKEDVDLTEETVFIGHSIGCQTILRFLEKESKKVKAVILVAPWKEFNMENEEEESKDIAKPWIETPIKWDEVKSKAEKFIAFFSDNDPYVPLSQVDLFKKELEAKTIIMHNKNHISENEFKILPEVLNAIKEI